MKHLLLLSGSAVLCLPAQAALVSSFQQVGPDVVMTTTGFVNMAGLADPWSYSDPVPSPGMSPSLGNFLTGSPASAVSWLGINLVPLPMGPGFALPATSGTGPLIGIFDFFEGFGPELFLPPGYVTNTPLATSTATYANNTIAGLGLTPGSYVWGWGAGLDADTWTITVPSASIIPEPSTYIALAGFAALGIFVYRRRKSAKATAEVAIAG